MFDDVLGIINDWFPDNQQLAFEESTLNSSNISNELMTSESNLSVLENNSDFTQQSSLFDTVESDNNFNSLSENSVTNYDNNVNDLTGNYDNNVDSLVENSVINSDDNINTLSENSVTNFDDNVNDLAENSVIDSQENLQQLASVNEVPETETLSYSYDPFYDYDNSWNYYVYEENWDISEFDGIGNPFTDADCWQQQEGQNSCAVVAQMGVYESITGAYLSEDEVCQFAQENGLFHPDIGTYPDDVGKILNHFGVPTDSYYNADLNDIASALERGDKVIVGLDANEIWQPLRDAYGNPIEQSNAGHAVWVTGIDQADDGSIKIILNDSGTPDGQMKVVDAVDFSNAWNDFGNQIVIADTSSVIA